MTDIWDKKPKSHKVDEHKGDSLVYNAYWMDAWLEKLKTQWELERKTIDTINKGLEQAKSAIITLEDYMKWWMELRELLSGYLVDCDDSDIIFSQLKEWKEKAEKWDELMANSLNIPHLDDLLENTKKLEAIKELVSEVDETAFLGKYTVLWESLTRIMGIQR